MTPDAREAGAPVIRLRRLASCLERRPLWNVRTIASHPEKREAQAWVGILQNKTPKALERRRTPTHAGA